MSRIINKNKIEGSEIVIQDFVDIHENSEENSSVIARGIENYRLFNTDFRLQSITHEKGKVGVNETTGADSPYNNVCKLLFTYNRISGVFPTEDSTTDNLKFYKVINQKFNSFTIKLRMNADRHIEFTGDEYKKVNVQF